MAGAPESVRQDVLQVRGVSLRRGSRQILNQVGFSVPRGGLLALMGPSGSGKTTILRVIAALDPFDQGSIAIDDRVVTGGHVLAGTELRRLRSRIGLVFQFHHLFEHLTVLKNVTLAPLHVHHVAAAAAEARARELLKALDVEHRANALPRELSGGEAQRVAIARALAVQPRVLFFDEPTSALDPEMTAEVLGVIEELKNEGRHFVLVTHAMGFARRVGDVVAFLAEGRIVERGPAAQLFEAPQTSECREFLSRVLRF